MKKILTFLIMAISYIAYCGLLPSFKISKQGILEFPNGRIQVEYMGRKWTPSNNKNITIIKGYPRENATSWNTAGMWNVNTGEYLRFSQKIIKLSAIKYLLEANISSEEKVFPNEISLSVVMSSRHYKGSMLRVDEKNILLPEKYSQVRLGGRHKAKTLSIPTPAGTLTFSGNMNLIIQDNRKWKHDEFSVRIRFSPYHGELKKSGIKVDFELKPYSTTPINISKQCNMGFKDEFPGDKKGGWTDQGINDLRIMRPGKKKFLNVGFDVIDPAQNEGKSCMVFKGRERPYFLDQAAVDAQKASYQAIYLLHATAWRTDAETCIGSIQVKYLDNSDELIQIIAKKDVDDWFNGDNKPNGRNVWTGKNMTHSVSLYLSKFKIQNKPVDKFIFKSNNNSVWMVVAMSGGDDIPIPKLYPSAIITGKDWTLIQNDRFIEPGSALDFSKVIPKHKPAGKFGFTVIKNSRFEFEGRPGVRQRFYGVNVIPPYYRKYDYIDQMAEYVSSMGYNAVRLHHYDNDVIDKSASCSTKLDEEGMKQFDYIFYKLKERGIYISTDLYSRRMIKVKAIKGIQGTLSIADFRALVAVNPDAWQNWKEFASNVLEHTNAYTGIKLKNDPALFSICLVNEDNIHHNYSVSSAMVKKIFMNAYKKSGSKKDFYSYLTELGIKFYKKSSAYLRSIGVKALLTSCNAHLPGMAKKREIMSMRNQYDYVDNHSYWDHGKYNKKTQRWEIRNNSALTENADTPRNIMGTRIFGKPFMITEFNYCYPNHYRAEGGPLVGAYCSLQDYDGIFRFNLVHFPRKYHYISHFSFAYDPIAVLSERIGLLFFLRGDVKESKNKIPVVCSINHGSFPARFNLIGLVSQIGGLYAGSKLPSNVLFYTGYKEKIYKEKYLPAKGNIINAAISKQLLDKNHINLETGVFMSDTNQLKLSSREKFFSAITPKSECFILRDGQIAGGHAVSVNNKLNRSVIFAGSLDNKTIASSSSLLILHLTDAQNSGAIYTDQFHTCPIKKGRLPAVVKTGEADIVIKTNIIKPQVWAIDLSGRRLGVIPSEKLSGKLKFTLKTKNNMFKQAIMGYEVVSK